MLKSAKWENEVKQRSSMRFSFWELCQITYRVHLSVCSGLSASVKSDSSQQQSVQHMQDSSGAQKAQSNLMAKVYLQVIISANRWITACWAHTNP